MQAEIQPGRNFLAPIESGTKGMVSRFLERPWIREHVVPHLDRLVTFATMGDTPSLNGGMLYLLGAVTREVPGGDIRNESIPLRSARADAFLDLQADVNRHTRAERIYGIAGKLPASAREKTEAVLTKIGIGKPESPQQFRTRLHEKAETTAVTERTRKRLTEQLYAHTLVSVDTAYGKLGGQVSVLNPDAAGTPIVLIPGSSNDPESFESAAVEIALQTGQRVEVYGYPDAPNGLITDGFARAVQSDVHRAADSYRQDPARGVPPTYEAYTEFFDRMIARQDPGETFELWGYSGGGAIAAKLLSRPEYQRRVTDAVLLNPGGSATFSVASEKEFQNGSVTQTLLQFAEGKHFPRYTWWDDPRDAKTDPDKRNKFDTWFALGSGCHYRIPDWETIRVRDSGRILVYSGGHDYITKSYRTFGRDSHPDNPQMDVLFDATAHHSSILARPDAKIGDILAFRRGASQQPQPE